jgi:hypothetical protein
MRRRGTPVVAVIGAVAALAVGYAHTRAAAGAPPPAGQVIGRTDGLIGQRFQLSGYTRVVAARGGPLVVRYDVRRSDMSGRQEWNLVTSRVAAGGRWVQRSLYTASALHDPPVTAVSSGGGWLAWVDQPPAGDRGPVTGHVVRLADGSGVAGGFTQAGWHVDALSVSGGAGTSPLLIGMIEEQNRADHTGRYRWRLVGRSADGWHTIGTGSINPLIEIGPWVAVAQGGGRAVVAWRSAPDEDDDDGPGWVGGAVCSMRVCTPLSPTRPGIVPEEATLSQSLAVTGNGTAYLLTRAAASGDAAVDVLRGASWHVIARLGVPTAAGIGVTRPGLALLALRSTPAGDRLELGHLSTSSWDVDARVTLAHGARRPSVLPGGWAIDPSGGAFYLTSTPFGRAGGVSVSLAALRP